MTLKLITFTLLKGFGIGLLFFPHIFPNSLKVFGFLFTVWYIFGYNVTCSIVSDFRSHTLYSDFLHSNFVFNLFLTSVYQNHLELFGTIDVFSVSHCSI